MEKKIKDDTINDLMLDWK